MITNALSVDVEEYYHAAIFRHGTRGLGTGSFESRVEQSVERLLGLLSDHFARGTFFVLGEIATHHPGVVRKIAAQGHEIACHGDGPDDVYRLRPREFRADIRRAKMRIEDAVGDPVTGYRAPNFSIGQAQSWAYKILLEEGFRYDSSMSRSCTTATVSRARRASRTRSGATGRRASWSFPSAPSACSA